MKKVYYRGVKFGRDESKAEIRRLHIALNKMDNEITAMKAERVLKPIPEDWKR